MFGGLFSVEGEEHEFTQNNDSSIETTNAIFNLVVVFNILNYLCEP